MTDLRRRTATAVVYGAVVLMALVAPQEVFYALLGVIVGIALLELAALRRAGIAAALLVVVLAAGAVSLAFLRTSSAPIFGPLRVPSELMMTLLAVWAADVAGYLVGSSIGRRKIVPRVSPGKTWEGTIAGFLAAAGVIVLWNRPELGPPSWVVVTALLIGPAAFAGDLLESWVKRRAGVKDSGGLLPGHGGVLDRVDSLFAAAPLVAAAFIALDRLG